MLPADPEIKTFDAQTMTIVTTNAQTTGYYQQIPISVPAYDYWLQAPGTYYPYPATEDKGRRAFTIAKQLIEAKLVQIKTAKQFVVLMDTLLVCL